MERFFRIARASWKLLLDGIGKLRALAHAFQMTATPR
jgi:hypothetical protein